jgi:hypothetical protein
MPTYAATIEYTNPPAAISTSTLAGQIETRARELYAQNESFDLEKYRHEAIKQVNEELQTMVYTSPFIDYDELAAKYDQ